MNLLNKKTIIITGASKGIGKAIAIALGKLDTNLALMARSSDELEQVQKLVISNGSQCKIYAGDVANEAFVNASTNDVIKHFGTIDILINNAGFGIFKSAEETTAQDWDAVFATNAKGTFLMSKAAIPVMKKNKAGHIINVASDVAKRTFAGGALYCASKFAQEAFSSAIRKELRPFNVKVSVVYSGLVDSSFHAAAQGDEAHKEWLKNEDMANAICFIASQPAHVVIDELMIHPISQDY